MTRKDIQDKSLHLFHLLFSYVSDFKRKLIVDVLELLTNLHLILKLEN